MSDWQLGYSDGRYYVEHFRGSDRAASGKAQPLNPEYIQGWEAGAEDATSDRKIVSRKENQYV